MLAQHPHLLDAGLARVLAHVAVALPLGAQLWRHLEGRSRRRPTWWPAAVFICGIAGAWLAVRTAALGVAEEGIDLASAERSPPWRTYAALLLDTRYGTAWLAYAGCLALAVLPQARSWTTACPRSISPCSA